MFAAANPALANTMVRRVTETDNTDFRSRHLLSDMRYTPLFAFLLLRLALRQLVMAEDFWWRIVAQQIADNAAIHALTDCRVVYPV
jgi:hypothetical protein